VSSLITRNLLDVAVKGRVVTDIGKVLLGKVGETLEVELVLEMLKSKSVVEDDTVVDGGSTLLNSGSGGDKASGGEGKTGREVHFE
jgi:hypothetical protein